MIDPLQTVIWVSALVLALAALVNVIRDHGVGWWLLGGLGLLELAILVQGVLGIAQLVSGDRDVNGFTFVGYLVGMLLIVPIGAAWALSERSRSGTAVIVVVCLVVPVLVVRLESIWSANA